MTKPTPSQPMETRCSVAVFRQETVLLLRCAEPGPTVWKLPGGHVHASEGLVACARRELYEETGLTAENLHCAFLMDTHDRATGRFMAEIVLYPVGGVPGEPRARESGREPVFVPVDSLDQLLLQPPIATHLRDLLRLHARDVATYDSPPCEPLGFDVDLHQLR